MRRHSVVLLGALLCMMAAGAHGQQPAGTSTEPRSARGPAPTIDMGLRFGLEPKAVEILKAASAKLAAARTLRFTAIAMYESAARTGQPLAYTTRSEVTLERPDKLRIITPGDGPPSDFIYDGKTVMAYSPDANLVAVATAPPTIDEMLKAAYDVAAIYFPFTDLIVADPYKDLSEGLKLAFVVGQSKVAGDTTTDIVVIANDSVQVQLWIGADDHLPRMARATYFDEPAQYRHQVAFSHWVLDAPTPPGTFASAAAANARRVRFGAPGEQLPASTATGGTKP